MADEFTDAEFEELAARLPNTTRDEVRGLPRALLDVVLDIIRQPIPPLTEEQRTYGVWAGERFTAERAARKAERIAVVAYLRDRAGQYKESSRYQAFVDELVGGICDGDHVEAMRHGEFDDLRAWATRLVERGGGG